ncbi:tRNA 2-selenouridine(34) synthase MnmH [Palleronia sediminis]|uniref:tRNA 2-selenouridine(34) synthase MnmH n=1 Tax=Palleronia sediminis TaxID=2547833 RepID=A0A4R6AE01_9RHOB|nr:tRNA 2-selenouridine(34) synthase MnmH [Palleronia sediminis]TDL79676.1 tRNA 2-selenouridine(34) synthase MnmH [Palleronia sediminis]
MSFAPHSLEALRGAGFDAVIDVRSPSEYAEDRVPGAINLPVLDDAERARIGTVYVRQSAFLARKMGAALVARNAAAHIEGPLAGHGGGWRPLVYCWRGGQRSNSFASILSQIGWRVSVLEGGYRGYRALVKEALYDRVFAPRTVLLDGFTGTAKTAILRRAGEMGAQVIDLEGLANHRGSLFGGQGGQPAQKAFESALAQAIGTLDPTRPVLIEAESSKVGDRVVPPSLWRAMQTAPRIVIEAPLAARAAYSLRDYADIAVDPARLDATLDALVPLQGRERVAAWRALAASGQLGDLAAALMTHHYDPRYARQSGRETRRVAARLRAERLDPAEIDALAAEVVAHLG